MPDPCRADVDVGVVGITGAGSREVSVNRHKGEACDTIASTPARVSSPSRVCGTQRRPFPTHWGDPPVRRTRDQVQWPQGYGAGSSTIARWIEDNLERDENSTHVAMRSWYPAKAAGGEATQTPSAASAKLFQQQPPQDLSGVASTTLGDSLTVEPPSQSPRRWVDPADRSAGVSSFAIVAPEQPPATPAGRRKRFAGHPLLGSSAMVPLGQRERSLAVRMGAVTMRKVVEMEKMLLEELETTLVLKAGFISSCLHSWRRQVSLQSARREHDAELHRARHAFERHLAQLDVAFREDSRRSLRARRLQMREAIELVVFRWQEGHAFGLLHEMMYLWAKVVARDRLPRLLRAHGRSAKGVVWRLASGSCAAALRVAVQAWAKLCADLRRVRAHQSTTSKALRNSFEGAARMLLQSAFLEWRARARRVVACRARWAASTARGLSAAVLLGWKECWRLGYAARAGQRVLGATAARFLRASDRNLLRGTFLAWVFAHSVDVRIRNQQEELLTAVAGERARMEARGQALMWHEARRRNAAKESALLAVEKWTVGMRRGHLHTILHLWRLHGQRQSASARVRSRVSRATLQWLEGQRRGLAHSCFLGWKHVLELAVQSRSKEAELQEQKHALEQVLAREQKRSEELAEKLRASERRARRSAHVVEHAIRATGLELMRSLITQVFQSWLSFAEMRRRLAAKSVSVRMAMTEAVEGQARSVARGCVLSWRALAVEAMHRRERRAAVVEAVFKWARGEEAGLLAAAIAAWQRLAAKTRQLHQKHQLVVLRLMDSASLLLKESMRSWAAYTAELTARRRAEEALKLGEKLRRSQELQTMIRYIELMSGRSLRVLLGTVMAAWLTLVARATSERSVRQLESVLQDQQNVCNQWVARLKEAKRIAFDHLWASDSRFHGFICFFAWSRAWQEERQQRLHHLLLCDAVDQFSQFMLLHRKKSDFGALLQTCLTDWLALATAHRHERELHEHRHAALEQHSLLEDAESQNLELKEELQHTYRRMDQFAETLQHELHGKEELAAELREAYRWKLAEPRACGTIATPLTARPSSNSSFERGQWGDALRAHISLPWHRSPTESPSQVESPGAPGPLLTGSRFSSCSSPMPPGHKGEFHEAGRHKAPHWGSSLSTGISTATGGSHRESPPTWEVPAAQREVGSDSLYFGSCGDGGRPRRKSRSQAPESSSGHPRPGYGGMPLTPECDWDAALSRMRDEGLVGRRLQAPGDTAAPRD